MRTTKLSRILCAAMCAMLLIGCVSSALAFADVDFDISKNLEITWLGWNVNGLLPADESYIKNFVEDRYNVSIVNVPVDTYNEEQMNLVLSTGVDFDVDTACDNWKVLYDQGLLRAIDEEMVKQYAPFFYEKLEKFAADSWRTFAYADGKMYCIPAVRHSNTHIHNFGVRTDWMEAVGVTEVPKTLAELEELLLKFVTDDPDGNGINDTYALTKMDYYCDMVFGAFGGAISGWLADEEGNPIPAVIQDSYKEGLKVLRRWYEEGIFDPECMYESRKTCIAKFCAGTIGGYSGNNWAYVDGNSNSPVYNAHLQGIDVEMTLIPPVVGETGLSGTLLYGDPVNESGMVFGRNCSDEEVIRVLQLLNDEMSDLDLYATVYAGEHGIDWTRDEDGYIVLADEMNTNERHHEVGESRYLFNDFWCDEFALIREAKERAEVCQYTNGWATIPMHALNSYSTEADSEYTAATDKVSEEFFLKALVGDVDIDAEWDAYVTKWLKAGGQERVEAKQEAWNDMK